MTNQELRPSVLWCLDKTLGRSLGEFVKGFRWCPECIYEMEILGQEPYFKLIWHLSAIKACHIHRTPLIKECEFCGCTQVSYIKKRSIGLCQDCGQSLGRRKNILQPNDILHSWEDIGIDVVKLFSDIADVEPNSLPTDGVKKSLVALFDYYWENDRENEFYQLISRDEMLSIIHGSSRISFKNARIISYRLGTSIFTLMSGDAVNSNEYLDIRMFCKLPPGYLEAKKKQTKDHEMILEKVHHVLKACENPPSLKKLANHVEVSVGYLSYRHPVLAKDIVTEHKKFREQQQLKKIYQAQLVALRYFIDEKYAKHPQSRKQAYKKLREETGLPKFMLKKAIQSAYLALCYD